MNERQSRTEWSGIFDGEDQLEAVQKFKEVVSEIRHRFVQDRENRRGQELAPDLSQICKSD